MAQTQKDGRGTVTGRSRRRLTDQLTFAEGNPKPSQLLCLVQDQIPRELVEAGGKGRNVSAHSESRYQSSWSRRTEPTPRKRYHEGTSSRRTEPPLESEDSGGGHWKSKSKKQKSSIEEDDVSQPWVCEETHPFTSRVCYFDFPKKTWMPNNVKTYNGSKDPQDHLKIFQETAKVARWPMPTWCHMFNSTLTGSARVWFDDLPPESMDSYDDLKKAFLENFLQQKKCIKDPIEIHHIKQREGNLQKILCKDSRLRVGMSREP
nr:reverse transcriptase domain-containing protein [Tanacetum cinerariifolium]